jgi:hypothetical protein
MPPGVGGNVDVISGEIWARFFNANAAEFAESIDLKVDMSF